MIKEYNSVFGVPLFSYYLVRIESFGDFECPYEEKILFVTRNKQDLIDLCVKNNWHCVDTPTATKSGWDEYYIKYRHFF